MNLISCKFKREVEALPPDDDGVVRDRATGRRLCQLIIAFERPELPMFQAWLRTVKQTCGLTEEDEPVLPAK